MNTYLSHAHAQLREEEIRRSVESSRTATDVWHRTGGGLTDRLGRTLVHLGTRLLGDRQAAAKIDRHVTKAAA